MKTDTHFLSNIAQIFLELEMFLAKVVLEITTHILCAIRLFKNSAV